MRRVVSTAIAIAAIGGLATGCDVPEESDKSAPSAPTIASTKGKQPMKWGNWQLVGKIKVEKDFDGLYAASFKVKNTGDSDDTGTFTVTFLKGKKKLGSTECTTAPSLAASDIGPGDVSGVYRCNGTDFKKGWTEITIKDAF